jgi:hypothetical protein
VHVYCRHARPDLTNSFSIEPKNGTKNNNAKKIRNPFETELAKKTHPNTPNRTPNSNPL